MSLPHTFLPWAHMDTGTHQSADPHIYSVYIHLFNNTLSIPTFNTYRHSAHTCSLHIPYRYSSIYTGSIKYSTDAHTLSTHAHHTLNLYYSTDSHIEYTLSTNAFYTHTSGHAQVNMMMPQDSGLPAISSSSLPCRQKGRHYRKLR